MAKGTVRDALARCIPVRKAVAVVLTLGIVISSRQLDVPATLGPWVGIGSLLLLNWAPSMGDLLNGNHGRFWSRGGLRLAFLGVVMLQGLLGPAGAILAVVGSLGWLGWLVYDVVDSYNAPQRWLERNRPPPVPGDPLARHVAPQPLRFEF